MSSSSSSKEGVRYVSPHPPGNFHAIRDEPKLDGKLVGRVATSSTLVLGEIVDAGEDAKWGKILDLLESEVKFQDGEDASKDMLVGAWIMILNGGTTLLRAEESSPIVTKRPSDISTPWATPFHKNKASSEPISETTSDEPVEDDVVVKSLNLDDAVDSKEEEEEEEEECKPTPTVKEEEVVVEPEITTTTTSTESVVMSNESKKDEVKIVEKAKEIEEKPVVVQQPKKSEEGIDHGSFTGSKGYDLSWMNDPDAFPGGSVPSVPKASSSSNNKKKTEKKTGPPASLLKRLESKTIPKKKDDPVDEKKTKQQAAILSTPIVDPPVAVSAPTTPRSPSNEGTTLSLSLSL